MKQIQAYRGFNIKEFTKRDYGVSVRIGEYAVVDRDGNIEFDSIQSVDEAKEYIDGLKEDKQYE